MAAAALLHPLIRTGTPADRVAVEQLRGECGLPRFRHGLPIEPGWFFYVAHDTRTFLGYALCRKTTRSIYVEELLIHPDFRHLQVGSSLIDALVETLSDNRRSIIAHVPETNVSMQVFLHGRGFRAVKIVSGAKTSNYAMVYHLERPLYSRRIQRILEGRGVRPLSKRLQNRLEG